MVKKAAILGNGMIAQSLATLMAGNSLEVVLVGRNQEKLEAALLEVQKNFDELIREGLLPEGTKEKAMKLISVSSAYEALSDCDFIYEAVFEDVAIKEEVYKKAEQFAKKETVIASATSAISADILGEKFLDKSRFLVAHPWNPPHMVPLVEVVRSRHTSEEAVDVTRKFLETLGRKVVVLSQNIEGFIGNRLQHAMFREGLYMIEQGICTAEEINTVVNFGFGPRYSSIGLFEHFDCAGLPLDKQVEEGLFPTLCNADAPQKALLDAIERGDLGMKTGKGMLDWSKIDIADFRDRQKRPYYSFVNWNYPR